MQHDLNDVIYLDNHATTPIDPEVLDAMMPFLTDRFGNAASRTHAFGWDAEGAVDEARAQVARVMGARASEIVFTSGATESTNLALKGVAEFYSDRGDHYITAATEHKATLDCGKYLEAKGKRVTFLPVDADGLIDVERLADEMTDETVLVSIMMVNNEIGVIQPVEEIGRLCKERHVFFHVDAAQAYGKLPIDVQAMGIDLLSLSGHKIYGPKGVGALYVRGRNPRIRLDEQTHGGGHENGMRSGTLNVPGVVGLGAAAELSARVMDEEGERLDGLRQRLWDRLSSDLEGVHLNGHATKRVHGNLNVSFEGVEGESLLLGIKGVAVSSGSACTAASMQASYVLKALGLEDSLAVASLRFGIGRYNTEEEIDRAAGTVIETVRNLRALSTL